MSRIDESSFYYGTETDELHDAPDEVEVWNSHRSDLVVIRAVSGTDTRAYVNARALRDALNEHLGDAPAPALAPSCGLSGCGTCELVPQTLPGDLAPETRPATALPSGGFGTFEHTDEDGDRFRLWSGDDAGNVIVETLRDPVRVPIASLLTDLRRRAGEPEPGGLAQWERELLTATEPVPYPDIAAERRNAYAEGVEAGRAEAYAEVQTIVHDQSVEVLRVVLEATS